MQPIHFPSKDGMKITADYYPVENPKDYILLCHRSPFNRGEYREIAPKLNDLGYTCLAIDQRSGMNVLGVINETSTLAKEQKLPTGYLDAKPDIEAAIDFLYLKNEAKAIIVFGSSYSASLVLLLSKDNPKIKAVVAFSPGEYLKKVQVLEAITGLKKPLYITSAKKEVTDTELLLKGIDKEFVTHFKPEEAGQHGVRALWEKSEGYEEYWQSLKEFLQFQSA